MSVPTPREVAHILGLEAGLNAGPSRLRTGAEMDRYDGSAFLKAGTEHPAWLPFWHEFASLYLPSLLRTYYHHALLDLKQDIRCQASLWSAIQRIMTPAVFGLDLHFERFARARPEETISFFLTHCQQMRAHQKQHWKTHKPFCFPPGW